MEIEGKQGGRKQTLYMLSMAGYPTAGHLTIIVLAFSVTTPEFSSVNSMIASA
jgi:hypothetical protein